MADEIYARFDKLRSKKGVTVYAVSKETGITTTTFTNWKKGKYTPKPNKLQLIADYFNVSLEYLVNGSEQVDIIEIVEQDVELTNMSDRLKEYALKISKMPKDKQEHIMQLIDMLEK